MPFQSQNPRGICTLINVSRLIYTSASPQRRPFPFIVLCLGYICRAVIHNNNARGQRVSECFVMFVLIFFGIVIERERSLLERGIDIEQRMCLNVRL